MASIFLYGDYTAKRLKTIIFLMEQCPGITEIDILLGEDGIERAKALYFNAVQEIETPSPPREPDR